MMDEFYALKMAYRKHCLNDDSIGWEELGNILFNTLCNEMGSEEFCEWVEKIKSDNNL